MKGENSLDPFVGNNSADSEGFVDAATFACDYCAGENLDAFLVAFFNLAAYVNRIAYFEMRYIFFKAFAFNSIEQLCFHVIFPLAQC